MRAFQIERTGGPVSPAAAKSAYGITRTGSTSSTPTSGAVADRVGYAANTPASYADARVVDATQVFE